MLKYFRDIFRSVWSVLIGMKVTFRHLFTPAVTIQYPDVKLKLPERARNRLYVNMDDCIGCFQCDMACPVDCFKIETVKGLPTEDLGMTSTGQKKRLWVPVFDIDIAKCCYCGLCVYPCPTECIKMTDVYEFSETNRHHLIYNYATMTPAEASEVRRRAAEFEKEQTAKKAAAAAAAKKTPPGSPPAPPTPGASTPPAPGASTPHTPGTSAPPAPGASTPPHTPGTSTPPAPGASTPGAPPPPTQPPRE